MESKPRRTNSEIELALDPVSLFVRKRRKRLGYTQQELADRTGTSLNFVKSIERGKPTLRMDKVNLVLQFFGARLTPGHLPEETPRDLK